MALERYSSYGTADSLMRHLTATLNANDQSPGWTAERVHLDVFKMIHPQTVNFALQPNVGRAAILACDDMIQRGIACPGRHTELSNYRLQHFAIWSLVTKKWPEELAAETANLLRSYIRGFKFDLSDAVNPFGVDKELLGLSNMSALEASIRLGHWEAVPILIEEGASLDMKTPFYDSMIDLARACVRTRTEEFVAMMNEAAFQHAIKSHRDSDSPHPAAADALSAPQAAQPRRGARHGL